MTKIGRPTILTDELTKKFISNLRISGSIETAIKACHIGRETFYGWQRELENGGGTPESNKFMLEVEEAEAEVKRMREHFLYKHLDKNWQAVAWWLERRYPREYGRRQPAPLADENDREEPEIERIQWIRAEPLPPKAPLLIEGTKPPEPGGKKPSG